MAGALVLSALLVPGAAEARKRMRLGIGPGTANPSELIATEIALGRRAMDKGLAKALRDAAMDEAVVLAPDPVPAKDWLSRHGDGLGPQRWDAKSVWMSCDGTLGVTRGTWRDAAGSGPFVRVWQQRKPGDYRWVAFAEGPAEPEAQAVAAKPDDELETLSASVAECIRRAPDAPPVPSVSLESRASTVGSGGMSRDGTLAWSYAEADGGGTLEVSLRKAGAMVPVIDFNLSAASVAALTPPRGYLRAGREAR
ncbi:hypothetical protein [Novosphingobium sp. 9]|uniref:hypothetical protein n=1 Tax=Novosphingobium sp. 9 TaxID=2025349 RepID=UPI0021B5218E|nr:hypothetical protein [Novosphingobium sp. 9]